MQKKHQERADALTANWRAKHAAGVKDPIEDFLFEYYSYRPALLRRWHPGAGVVLEGSTAELAVFEERRWYRSVSLENGEAQFELDAVTFLAERGRAVDYIEKLLGLMLNREAKLGCFGLHEWAMVYKQPEEQLRHQKLPLRLGAQETDRVVEKHKIVCSHFDAYRFFTPEASPLNLLRPSRKAQEDFEQPGCLHAGMDNYKWAVKLGPIIPGDLLLDTFELAKDIRVLDMRASPYDVSAQGLTPVAIETDAGKSEYVQAQAEFALRGQALRVRILQAIQCTRDLSQSRMGKLSAPNEALG